jgi:glycosidase
MEIKKLIIYQVLPRLFGNNTIDCESNGDIQTNGCGKMNDFTADVLEEFHKAGITHIWYTGIIEHATQTDYTRYGIRRDHPAVVKGKAGSPYAIKDYYDVDPDLAVDVPNRMKEFEALVARTHQAGIDVIIDFVPNHVARQYHSDAMPKGVKDLGANDNVKEAFSPQNNFYYIPDKEFHGNFDMKAGADKPYYEYPAKATGNDKFDAEPNLTDWYETVKLNYGVDYVNGGSCHFSPIPDTWKKMLDILLFWSKKNVDAFRCDMAEMVPIDFWGWAIPQIKKYNENILFIGEVYNPRLYHDFIEKGHFDYLYDKVGLYDTLHNIICGYASASSISACWQSLNGLEKNMLYFLENHDEQRIASDFFAKDPWKAIPAVIVSACMNTNPFMVYSGQELGEMGMDSEGFSGRDGRTSIFDYWSIPSIRLWRELMRAGDTKDEEQSIKLRNLYIKILGLCNTENAISQGVFFDLTYANINGWRFNEYKQFAFMRKYKRELLFIVVNFDNQPVNVAVNIPSHAFDFLNIPQQDNYKATDLLTGKEDTISLLPYKATDITLEKWSGNILKINL